MSSIFKVQAGQIFDKLAICFCFLKPSLRGTSAPLETISDDLGVPCLVHLGDIWGVVFKVDFDKQFGGVKSSSRTDRKGVPGDPGPHQEALS